MTEPTKSIEEIIQEIERLDGMKRQCDKAIMFSLLCLGAIAILLVVCL